MPARCITPLSRSRTRIRALLTVIGGTRCVSPCRPGRKGCRGCSAGPGPGGANHALPVPERAHPREGVCAGLPARGPIRSLADWNSVERTPGDAGADAQCVTPQTLRGAQGGRAVRTADLLHGTRGRALALVLAGALAL